MEAEKGGGKVTTRQWTNHRTRRVVVAVNLFQLRGRLNLQHFAHGRFRTQYLTGWNWSRLEFLQDEKTAGYLTEGLNVSHLAQVRTTPILDMFNLSQMLYVMLNLLKNGLKLKILTQTCHIKRWKSTTCVNWLFTPNMRHNSDQFKDV